MRAIDGVVVIAPIYVIFKNLKLLVEPTARRNTTFDFLVCRRPTSAGR